MHLCFLLTKKKTPSPLLQLQIEKKKEKNTQFLKKQLHNLQRHRLQTDKKRCFIAECVQIIYSRHERSRNDRCSIKNQIDSGR